MSGGSRKLCLMTVLQQPRTLSGCVRSVLSPVYGNDVLCMRCRCHIYQARNPQTFTPVRRYSNTVNGQKIAVSQKNKENLLNFPKSCFRMQTIHTFPELSAGASTQSSTDEQMKEENINPLARLQQHVAVPLIKEKDIIFKPSLSEIARGQQLFVPSSEHRIEFLKSAMLEEQLPVYDLPEVAFIGRSNVGKSTLISMLLSHTDVIVKCSKHPGHTKLLNFFQVGKCFTLVDMPGYGYNMPKHYTDLVEKFLASRKKLCRTFMLVDGSVGVTETDVIGLNMLEEFHIPYVIVLTKIDKGKSAALIKNLLTTLKYRDQTNHCFPQPFLVSSTKGDGVPLLQAFIAYVTGNLAVEGL